MGINKEIQLLGRAYHSTDVHFYHSTSHLNNTHKMQLNFKYYHSFLTLKIQENILNFKRPTAFSIYPMFYLSMAIQKQIHTKFYPLSQLPANYSKLSNSEIIRHHSEHSSQLLEVL